jgi:hypothetical protein
MIGPTLAIRPQSFKKFTHKRITAMKADLSGYKRNVTSQFGEDGIVEEILNRIGIGNAFCVEFGAWDGKHLSNTWQLWHEKGWGAVLIEGEPDRAAQLAKSLASFPKVTSYRAFVGLTGESALDSILQKVGAPQVVDVLSIDIDGNDYHVFESLKAHSARVVLVEFNPTIPPHIELVAPPGNYFGSSALSLYKLAKRKGYSLAACTDTNLVLVRDGDFDKLGFAEPALNEIMPTDSLTYLITSFDGTSYLSRRPPYKEIKKLSLRNIFRAYGGTLFGRQDRDFAELKKQADTLIPVSVSLER